MRNDNISRQAALDAVSKWFVEVFVFMDSDRTADIFKQLRDLPSTDRNGHWIYHENDMCCVRWDKWECSECHERVENKSDYCPHCGADMRGK